MGLFDKIFEKKLCSICGGEIGLLGNRKLEDGNLCKVCAGKLSPFFSDRRNSTVQEIKEQLAYREENKKAIATFNPTRTLGNYTKIYLDEVNRKLVVSSARNLVDANADVLDFSQVTGCDVDVKEYRTEEKRKDPSGKLVSYRPERYTYKYDFYVTIHTNHPYFDEIDFRLNTSSIVTTPKDGVPVNRVPDPRLNNDYRECMDTADEIKAIFATLRLESVKEAIASAAPKSAETCPWCGATTIPDANGCCEYCGGSLK